MTRTTKYKNLFTVALSAIVGAAGPAQAETNLISETPIVVTATRFAASIDTAPVNVTTITAEDIARSSATTLADVLKYQAGVNVSDLFGISGSKTKIDMGGFGENGGANTLILVNGRRLNDVDLQGANIAAIPLDGIARVEIVNGSATVLYGDNAVSGVINIVTKSAYDGEHASARLQTGSFQTQRLSADLRKLAGKTALSLAADGMKSNGYRDNSALENFNLMAEASRENDRWTYGARINANREKVQLPGPINEPLFDSNPKASTATLEKAKERRYAIEGFIEGETVLAELSYSKKHQEATVYGDTTADLSTLSFTPRANRRYGRHSLVTGIDLYRSRLDAEGEFTNFAPPPATSLNGSDTTRDSYALYITDAIAFGDDTSLNLGARHQQVKVSIGSRSNLGGDSADQRSDSLNAGDITLSHKHAYGGRNYVRLARSFRSPVLDEMWSYFDGATRLLKPQTANHLEIGTRQGFRNGLQLDANLFRMALKDEIAYDVASGANVNLDKTRRDGLNLNLHAPLNEQLTVTAGYAYRKATYRDGANEGKSVPLVPRDKLTLSGQYRFTTMAHLGLDAVYTGRRYFGNDDSNAGKKMPAYTRLDLNYSRHFGNWTGRVLIQNLTDVEAADSGFYSTWSANPYFYYPLPERAVYLQFEGDL